MVNSCVVDDLHTIYLGVVKKITQCFVDMQVFGKYQVFDLIDEEISQNKGIHEISSITGLSMLADWKGKELMSWLLYHGVPFLNEYADKKFTHSFTHLSNCIYILSLPVIHEHQYDISQAELNMFMQNFGELYGDQLKGPNYHELCHLLNSVKMTGPLFVNSTFNFERLNFDLR